MGDTVILYFRLLLKELFEILETKALCGVVADTTDRSQKASELLNGKEQEVLDLMGEHRGVDLKLALFESVYDREKVQRVCSQIDPEKYAAWFSEYGSVYRDWLMGFLERACSC